MQSFTYPESNGYRFLTLYDLCVYTEILNLKKKNLNYDLIQWLYIKCLVQHCELK